MGFGARTLLVSFASLASPSQRVVIVSEEAAVGTRRRQTAMRCKPSTATNLQLLRASELRLLPFSAPKLAAPCCRADFWE